MRKALFAALCGLAALNSTFVNAAPNAMGQAIQNLHLSPQQLLSLRDFLGGFDRGVDLEADGVNHFVLRDAASKAYAGELLLQVGNDGVLQVDRVSGPARLNAQRTVLLPLHMDSKTRAQLAQALLGSQLVAPSASTAGPQNTVAGLDPSNSAAFGAIVESRGVFFRDGSGSVRTVRTTLGPSPLPARIADRFLSPIKSDGKQVWRDSVIQVDAILQMAFADLQARACSADSCKPAARTPAPDSRHVIRWNRQLIAAVPASLLAQMMPPLAMVVAPENPAESQTVDSAAAGTSASTALSPSEAASPDSGGR